MYGDSMKIVILGCALCVVAYTADCELPFKSVPAEPQHKITAHIRLIEPFLFLSFLLELSCHGYITPAHIRQYQWPLHYGSPWCAARPIVSTNKYVVIVNKEMKIKRAGCMLMQ